MITVRTRMMSKLARGFFSFLVNFYNLCRSLLSSYEHNARILLSAKEEQKIPRTEIFGSGFQDPGQKAVPKNKAFFVVFSTSLFEICLFQARTIVTIYGGSKYDGRVLPAQERKARPCPTLTVANF